MSKYVPDLLREPRNVALVENSVKNIFEKGIIPIANKKGYELSVILDDGGVSWEDFVGRWFSGRMRKYIGTGSNGLYRGIVSIGFNLYKEGGKQIEGQFYFRRFKSSSDVPRFSIELYPMAPNKDGQPAYVQLGWDPSERVDFVKKISPDNIEGDLECLIDEYEGVIFPTEKTLAESKSIQSKLA